MGFITGMQECFSIYKSINRLHHINRIKKKVMIISTIAEKVFNEIHYSFMMKTPNKFGMKRSIFQHNTV